MSHLRKPLKHNILKEHIYKNVPLMKSRQFEDDLQEALTTGGSSVDDLLNGSGVSESYFEQVGMPEPIGIFHYQMGMNSSNGTVVSWANQVAGGNDLEATDSSGLDINSNAAPTVDSDGVHFVDQLLGLSYDGDLTGKGLSIVFYGHIDYSNNAQGIVAAAHDDTTRNNYIFLSHRTGGTYQNAYRTAAANEATISGGNFKISGDANQYYGLSCGVSDAVIKQHAYASEGSTRQIDDFSSDNATPAGNINPNYITLGGLIYEDDSPWSSLHTEALTIQAIIVFDEHLNANQLASAASYLEAVTVPSIITAPTVSGVGYAGQTLTSGTGTWLNADSYTYQWYVNGTILSGETNSTYVVPTIYEGAEFTCSVAAVNSVGSSEAVISSNSIHHWVPLDDAGVRYWWSPDQLVTVDGSSNVTSWNDKIQNNALTGSGTWTVDAINSRPVLDTDAASTLTGTIDLQPDAAVFMLANVDTSAAATDETLFSLDPGNSFNVDAGTASADTWYGQLNQAAALGDVLTPSTVNLLDSDVILGYTMQATSNARQVRIDGDVDSSDTGYLDAGWTDTDDIPIAIGGRTDDDRYINGKFGDLIICETTDSTLYEKIEGYLAHKYNITLASGHTYENAAPTSSDFTIQGMSQTIYEYDASDASQFTLVGSDVDTWIDKSSSSLDLGFISQRPSWADGEITFAGGGGPDRLSASLAHTGNYVYAFYVFKAADGSALERLITSDPSSDGAQIILALRHSVNDDGSIGMYDGGWRASTSAGVLDDTYKIIVARVDDMYGSFRINGAADGTPGALADADTTLMDNVTLGIGVANASLAHSSKGFVYTNERLYETDILKIEGFLAWSYDMVDDLPSYHPYKNYKP